MSGQRPHIVLVIPRGEAVRNFLYSNTLPHLAEQARVTVLSVIHDDEFAAPFRELVDDFLPLPDLPPPRLAYYLRTFTENAHDRWLWSQVAQNNWQLRDRRAAARGKLWREKLVKAGARLFTYPTALRALTALEQELFHLQRPTRDLDALLLRLQPDLVFNGSHIHGMAGELPLRVAHRLGQRTAGFVFSWDNLTSRSRIFVPYDDYLVWHQGMARQLHEIYPFVGQDHIHVTGTPQFDFHFQPDYHLSREETCRRMGIDPSRPYICYTAAIAHHFPEEHRHLELIIRLLDELDLPVRPQLVVRVNVKDTSPEMKALAARGLPDVLFPPVQWDAERLIPRRRDLATYTSLLRHAALGINAASTVTLELLMLGKPVINLDFDPPGIDLPWCLGYQRHIRFDHYWPVAESGAVMVARSPEDMRTMLRRGLTEPDADRAARRRFLDGMFGTTLDGNSGRRVAASLLRLARSEHAGTRDCD